MISEIISSCRKSFIQGNWSLWMGMIVMIVLPVHVQFLPPFMIAWLIISLIERAIGLNRLTVPDKKIISLSVLFGLYFMVMVLSLFYSYNKQTGYAQLFRSLSLIVFPIILFSPHRFTGKKTWSLLKVFAGGTTFYIIVCFAYALLRSADLHEGIFVFNPHPHEYPWNSYFYATDFSFSQHPSYLAMYVLISVFIALEVWWLEHKKRLAGKWWLATAIFLTGSLYFISSRAGILSLMVLLPMYLVVKIKGVKFRFFGFVIIAAIIAVLSVVFLSNERIKNYAGEDPEKPLIERIKADQRSSIWSAATSVIIRNPLLGVGLGDTSFELKNEFRRLGFTDGYYENLNAHNQYLEVLLISGLAGLSIFIGILVYMLLVAIRSGNLLFGLFLIMMTIFFMF